MLLPVLAAAQGRSRLSLNGTWTFALDPVKIGEVNGWQEVEIPAAEAGVKVSLVKPGGFIAVSKVFK